MFEQRAAHGILLRLACFRVSVGVRSLLLRLFGLARDPAPLQRLSFALAINATYRQLREDANTLDVQLLEIFEKAFFALQLAENDPPALGTAQALEEVLWHLRRVLLKPAVLQRLLKPNPKRYAFQAGLTGRDGFAHWLFRGCAQREARAGHEPRQAQRAQERRAPEELAAPEARQGRRRVGRIEGAAARLRELFGGVDCSAVCQ